MKQSSSTMQSLIASDDPRSVTLLAGACVAGFALASPSPTIVRLAFITAATYALAMYLVAKHNASSGTVHRNDAATRELSARAGDYDRNKRVSRAGPKNKAPFASLVHPEVSAALSSLSRLSRPGRRAAVHAVVVATENVVRVYHGMLSGPGSNRPRACMDDLRDITIVALDALQGLRMQTGSRGKAAETAASAEHTLRGLFVRFRQIASNKLKAPELFGAPYAFDPDDDHHFVR